MFLGIADIRNGVIAMQDGRFLKLLELEPVGLFLRTPEEVDRILSSFAAWLRIAPDRLHFKCMTFPADTDSYADAFESDLEQEKHPACRSLGQAVAESLRKVGENGALSTRFLLILTAQERDADACRVNPFGSVRLDCSAFCVLRPICFLSERGDGIETKEKKGNQLYRNKMSLLRRERYLSVSGRNLSGESARGDAVCLLPIPVL